MADIKTPEERSLNMSRIKAKDTKPEIYIRKKLFERGYRYRKNYNQLAGHPDIWLSGYKTAIFVHGCFWHRHEGCRYSYMPKSRVEFWTDKFDRNIKRDKEVRWKMEQQGIRILVIWECTVNRMIKSESEEKNVLGKIESFLSSVESYREI